jgi:hypothetical protein
LPLIGKSDADAIFSINLTVVVVVHDDALHTQTPPRAIKSRLYANFVYCCILEQSQTWSIAQYTLILQSGASQRTMNAA